MYIQSNGEKETYSEVGLLTLTLICNDNCHKNAVSSLAQDEPSNQKSLVVNVVFSIDFNEYLLF